MRKIGLLISLVITQWSYGQTCLQKLDSAFAFQYSNPEKAQYFASSLLIDLDSGRCNTDIGIAGTYNNLGLLLWEMDEKAKGRSALEKGLSQQLNVKDTFHIDLLGIYYNLASMYQQTADFGKAKQFMRLAGGVVDDYSGEDKADVQITYALRQGIFFREVGDFDQSLSTLQEAINLTSLNDSLGISLQIELGTTYRYAGELEQSEASLTAAMQNAESVSETQYFNALERLSSLKLEQGEYSDSENYLLHSLKKRKESNEGDPLSTLETLNGLGILYYKLNDLESAEEYLSEALTTAGNVRTIRPYLINNLGTIYLKEGDLEKAQQYFEESAEGFKSLFGAINADYASSLSNLAGVFKQTGKLSEALNLYTKVLDMDKVVFGTNHPRYATSLNNVALLYLQLKNTSLAGKLLFEARKIRKEVLGDYHPLTIKTSNDLGLYYLITMDTTKAIEVFDQALESEIRHMQDIFPVLTDDQRQLYFQQARFNVERFCSLAFTESYISTKYAEDALNHFINTKGILFYASQKMRNLVQSSGDKEVKEIYEKWREKKYKLAQAYLLPVEERERQHISIEDLEEESIQLEKSLSLKFKVFAYQEKAAYHSWVEISNALEDSSATVDMIQYRRYSLRIEENQVKQGFDDYSDYVAFVILPDSVLKRVKYSKYVNFDKGFAKYRNSLTYGVRDISSFDTFWQPIDQHLADSKTVYFAPDGIFHKVNPGVLFDSRQQKYVLEKYDLLNITSGKDLLSRQTNRFRKDARIFGNPDFSKLRLDQPLVQLPGAEREAADITGILQGRRWKTNTLYSEQVTESSVKRLNNPGVVHIATHGYFEDDPELTNPLYSSGLYLSRSETSDDDGLLSAYEAMNLVLDQTKIVVLAACETGLGTIKNGEGVFGLQRAFLVAGAENVLISLVKIDDEAARKFMNLFYRELKAKEDPQRAFFDARLAFKKVQSNPYHWGAFILVAKG